MAWTPAVTSQLLRLATCAGRFTWIPSGGFCLSIVLVLMRESKLPAALLASTVLMTLMLGRAYFCAQLFKASEAQRNQRAHWFILLAVVEATGWAMTLLLLPNARPEISVMLFALSIGVALVGISSFALAGWAGAAYGAVLGFGQLMYLLWRPMPLPDVVCLGWALSLASVSVGSWWLRQTIAASYALREQADKGAREQQQVVTDLHRSREQLRLALEAIDAGIADVNLKTGERFFSARYAEILGFRDREAFLRTHRFSSALHPDDRARVLAARKKHLEQNVRFEEEFRLCTAALRYVWVHARAESERASNGRATRFVMSIVDITERRRAERQLTESERRYRALIEASPSLIWMCDPQGIITFVSARAALQLYGYEPREMIGRPVTAFNAPGISGFTLLRRFSAVLRGEPLFDVELTQLARNGQRLYLTVSAQPSLDENGIVESILGVASDITALKRREDELNRALRNQQAVFEAAGEGIVFVRDWRIESANRALAKMLGVAQEWLIGRPVEAILAQPDVWDGIRRSTFDAAVRSEATIHEVTMRVPDGSGRVVWCQLTSRAVEGDAMILVLTDITVLKRREELAWHQANHDELTGLANRRLLMEHARRLLSVAMRQRRLAAVMVLDLDGFKEVNDLFGHSHGDTLLRRVAMRLSSVLREYDVVARTGGDEFVILLPEIEQPAVAIVVAEKLIAASSENLEGGGRSLRIHASVGIALFPSDGHDFDNLLSRADAAMYAAKSRGKNQFCLAADSLADDEP